MNIARGTLSFRNAAATTHTVVLGNPPDGDIRKVQAVHIVSNGACNVTNFQLIKRNRSSGAIDSYVLDGGGTIAITAYNEFLAGPLPATSIFSTNALPYLWTYDGFCLEFSCTLSVSLALSVFIDYT